MGIEMKTKMMRKHLIVAQWTQRIASQNTEELSILIAPPNKTNKRSVYHPNNTTLKIQTCVVMLIITSIFCRPATLN